MSKKTIERLMIVGLIVIRLFTINVDAGRYYNNHVNKIVYSHKIDMYKVYLTNNKNYLIFDTVGEVDYLLKDLNMIGKVKSTKMIKNGKYLKVTFTNGKKCTINTYSMRVKRIK